MENLNKRIANLGILPLRDAVLFPGTIMPVRVGRTRTICLIEEEVIKRKKMTIGVLTQRSPQIEKPGFKDLFMIGSIAKVVNVMKIGLKNYNLFLQGITRMSLRNYIQEYPYLSADVDQILERHEKSSEIEAMTLNLKELTLKILDLIPNPPKECFSLVKSINDPSILADLVASILTVSTEEKQQILEAIQIKERLKLTLQLLRRQFEILKIKREISSIVQEKMGRSEREYLLRQQLKVIKEELGEVNIEEEEIEELKTRIMKTKFTSEAKKVANKQLERLKQMSSLTPEYTMTRTYLEWLLDLPWTELSEDILDINKVKEVLDNDHYNLEKVKKRIIEHIAVRKLKRDNKGPILCLVGPPGVGKTSLGRSIARAIGRKFIRVSLGGVRDEAEIRGHRRTYIGALPGRIIQGMKKAGTKNPVYMLDEVDKLVHDWRGDPAAALLEALDPDQNFSFQDHYLEIPYDLSQVMFICTANIVDTIPPSLLDRMEVIRLSGYTREEKFKIAENFLVPKQISEHGIKDQDFGFEKDGLYTLIDFYTREAGVRNLEREIAAVCRKIAVKIAREEKVSIRANKKFIEEVLGPPKFTSEVKERTLSLGVATGLSWTPYGGDIIFVEATKMNGKGNLVLTGQLGEVMKESAQTAFSFIRSRIDKFGIEEHALKHYDIHIHIPSGAIPKDGPSSGLTMLVAVLSLLTGVKVNPDIAICGEITLRGLLLPIKGVKEKILAAHRAGIKQVVLPKKNLENMDDIPSEVRKEIEVVFLERIEEVLPFVFKSPPGKTKLAPSEKELSIGSGN